MARGSQATVRLNSPLLEDFPLALQLCIWVLAVSVCLTILFLVLVSVTCLCCCRKYYGQFDIEGHKKRWEQGIIRSTNTTLTIIIELYLYVMSNFIKLNIKFYHIQKQRKLMNVTEKRQYLALETVGEHKQYFPAVYITTCAVPGLKPYAVHTQNAAT